MTTKIYVGNLSYDLSESELSELFRQFGEVESTKIITDAYTGKPKGFGFVEMKNEADAKQAITELDSKEVRGRAIKVNEARPQKERTRSTPFGGGSRDRDRDSRKKRY